MRYCTCVAGHVPHDPTTPNACLRAAVEMTERTAHQESAADDRLDVERREVRDVGV